MLSHGAEHILFALRKKERALGSGIVLLLACGAPYYHHSGVGTDSGFLCELIGNGHLLLAPGLSAPALTEVKGIFLRPFPVGIEQLGIEPCAQLLKSVNNAYYS